MTPEEQALWDQVIEWGRPESARVDPDDPIFKDALKIHIHLQAEDIAPWEKVRAIISQDVPASSAAVYEPVEKRRSFKWLVPVAASLGALIFGEWLLNKFNPYSPPLITVKTSTKKKDSLALPDGSYVWLNTTSSLQYSKKPAGNRRSVQLVGEAYFKVKKDSLNPFSVKTGGVEIVVLGTEFNVKGYGADSTVITLKEGNLLIRSNKKDSFKISSGEQAIVRNNIISISKTTDENKVLEWKKTFILLEGHTTQSVMEQIHSYYKIDYTIQAGLPPLALNGKLSTENTIDSIIKSLNDAADKIRFDLINKRIIVRKK